MRLHSKHPIPFKTERRGCLHQTSLASADKMGEKHSIQV